MYRDAQLLGTVVIKARNRGGSYFRVNYIVAYPLVILTGIYIQFTFSDNSSRISNAIWSDWDKSKEIN